MTKDRGETLRGPSRLTSRSICGLVGAAATVALTMGAVAKDSGAQAQTQIQTQTQNQNSEQAGRRQVSGDTVVARIDDIEVLLGEVYLEYQSLRDRRRQQGAQTPPFERAYPVMLQRVIARKLIARAARQASLDKSEEHKRQMRILEEQLLQEAYLRQIFEKEVTEQAMKARYQQFLKEYEGPVEVHTQHILVPTEEKAKEMIAELKRGADFAELAKKHSTDGSKERGGDLGYAVRDDLVAPYAEAAYKLKVGEYTTEPVQSPFGWHVIKLVDKRRRPAPEYEKVERDMRRLVAQEMAEKRVIEMADQSKIERFKLDGSPLNSENRPQGQDE